MYLEKINIVSQGMSSILSNHISDTNIFISRNSVLSIENSSDEFIGAKHLEGKLMDELDEPIYMNMRKDVACVSNSYEIFYDKTSHSYLFNKSLFIKNNKISPFFDLDKKEQESIFNYLKNKGFDTNKFLNKALLGSPIEKTIKEKIGLVDDLSKIICKDGKVNSKFKDDLTKIINNISLDELFSSCEKYGEQNEEQYDIQNYFAIIKFIYRFIENFNKSNNNKIKVNEDLKRRLNAFILLKSLKLKSNNII
ncbi:hypothetical protein [Proteus columbae]|uniref:hypothetical protein n=1 Tax=Proteus columbae TaxID=1987580 RepID=UPI00288ABEE7|nr:hypothetical protein [Proteus columbae]